VSLSTYAESPDFRSLITVRGVLPNGDTISVAGTLTGPRQVEKITDVNGFDIDIVPSEHLVFLRYADKPGIVGTVGAALGEAQVNIAGAQVSRTAQGGDALMVLTVDSAVPSEVLEGIATAIGAQSARSVDLA
jgi:D-3-phosphoglycerate dehydrogenase